MQNKNRQKCLFFCYICIDKQEQLFYNCVGDIMERQILHVDVNNAFLSWTAVEMLKNGSKIDIREIPSVIGGDENRRSGIVLAKSPKAKIFGISTGETLYQARMKCHNLQVYPMNYKLYKENSNKLYQLLLQYTDKIERFSIDECFLDMTNCLMGANLLEKGYEINKRVREELKFTVNVGVAHNKLLAKMASDFTKPDRVHTLFEDEIPQKMWPLSVSELLMLGRKTIPKLYNMRIKTIGQLANTDKELLTKKFGKHGTMMWEYANGIDNSEVHYQFEKPKGIGNSTTLPVDVSEMAKLEEVLLALTEQVTYRLRKYDMLANVVNVQLRTKNFEDTSHQRKLLEATSSTKEIYNVAKELLHEMYKQGTQIRLIGMRVDNLIEKDEKQLSFFDNEQNEKQEKLDKVVDELKQKYGYSSITRAGNLNSEGKIKLKDV